MSDVFLVAGMASNWVLIRDGQDLTLIDAGYPADVDGVRASVEQIGHRIEDVRGVLITHAHVDHIGAIPALQRRHVTPIFAHARELPMLRGNRHEQATTWNVVSRCWRPRVARWAVTVARLGARTDVCLPDARPIAADSAVDLPGSPVPILCAGHTSGHVAYVLPASGVVVTGDALITGHPTVARSGPQLLPAFFSHDQAKTCSSLDVLADLPADTVLPGHGSLWRGSLQVAVDEARAAVSNS